MWTYVDMWKENNVALIDHGTDKTNYYIRLTYIGACQGRLHPSHRIDSIRFASSRD